MKKTTSGQQGVKNINRVPIKAWSKWYGPSRATFNSTYDYMRNDASLSDLFGRLPPSIQRVMAWNAAWLAADNMNDTLSAIKNRLFPKE